MANKEQLVRDYARNHPDKSRTQLYRESVGTKRGMSKKKFLKIVRDERRVPHPSQEEQWKSTPIKYRDYEEMPRTVDVTEKTGGHDIETASPVKTTYIDQKMIHKPTGEVRYLRYSTAEQGRRIAKTCLDSEQWKRQNIRLTKPKRKPYKPWMDEELKV